MTVLRTIPAVLAALLLGAHFLRSGTWPLVLLALGLVPLAFVRRPWARTTVRIALLLGAVEWVRTAWGLARTRLAAGEPATRMLWILATVVAVTVVGAFVLPAAAPRDTRKIRS